MKAVILAGGLGTRISEESHLRPKPMIEIGGLPILWHIMKIYGAHGITDFVICCGYRGYMIKEYFANYFLHTSDVTFDLSDNSMDVHHRYAEPWRVTLVDTGQDTQTGGRLLRVREHLDDTFCLTYLDHAMFEQAGIEVDYMNYEFRPWPQSSDMFSPYVTALDLVAHVPKEQRKSHLKCSTVPWRIFCPKR